MKSMSKIYLLFLMYIVQKIFLCFSWAIFPIVLRKQGVSLGTIGFTALIYSPWCLKFLYAHVVDRYYSPLIGKRKSWIAPLLLLSCAGLPLLSLFPPDKFLPVLLIAVFVINWIFATTDIAVDGYATDILLPKERPWGNAAQMIGYIMGYMLGGGVFLIIYQNAGWQNTLLLITALQTLLTVPIILHKEIAPEFPINNGRLHTEDPKPEGSWSFIKTPQILWFCLFSMMLVIVDRGGGQLRLSMFVDMGMEPAALGRINIWIGSPMSIAGSIFGGMMLTKTGVRPAFIFCCMGCSGLHLFSAFVSCNPSFGTWPAGFIIGTEKVLAGIIFTMVFSMIMSLSAGNHSATHYAILGSLLQLAGLGIMPIMGRLCDFAGYFQTFLWLAAFGALTLFTGLFLLHQHVNLKTL